MSKKLIFYNTHVVIMHRILAEYRKRIGYSKLESDLMSGGTIPYNMEYLTANPQITIDFILEHPEIKWSWCTIFRNPNMSFVSPLWGNCYDGDEYLDEVETQFMLYNPNCTTDELRNTGDSYLDVFKLRDSAKRIINNPAIKYRDIIADKEWRSVDYPKLRCRWYYYASELTCAIDEDLPENQRVVCNPGLDARQHKNIAKIENCSFKVTNLYHNPQYLLIYYDCWQVGDRITNGNVYSKLDPVYFDLWRHSNNRNYLLNIAANDKSRAKMCYEILLMECGIYSRPEFMMAAIRNMDNMRATLYACKHYTDCVICYQN